MCSSDLDLYGGIAVLASGEEGDRIAIETEQPEGLCRNRAGDAFIGAMCAELARGSSLESACRVAAVAGALAATVRGAVPSLPTRAAVDRFLS